MLWLLYFGRLEQEKWIDAIIDMIEIFGKKNKELPVELFIFGSGSREKKIQELASRYPQIHFFWRQNLETIKRYVVNCKYCLIPSECLETFGLSALTAIQLWLPPIGYAKWWLKDFISDELDLANQPGTTTGQKLHNLIISLMASLIKEEVSADADGGFAKTKTNVSLHNYWKDSRVVRFHALARKETKKIIIVSDFINRIWGIETYINDVKELLEQHGYEVELFWWTVPAGVLGKFVKYLGIITGLGNFWEAIKLQRKIKKMKPDLIRYNSVMRYLWRMPIRASKNSNAKKRMMIHDLGYFGPFPSKLTEEKQIRTPFTLSHFLQTQPTKNPIKVLAMIGKYLSLSLIKHQLKKRIDTFLVPSAFIVDIAHKSYKIDKEKIKTFPHFIQE